LISKHLATVCYEPCLFDVAHPNVDSILVLEFLVISEIDIARVQTRQASVHDIRVFIAHVLRKATSSEGDEVILSPLRKVCRKLELIFTERRRQKLRETTCSSHKIVVNEGTTETDF
jgi:hypothetical protein